MVASSDVTSVVVVDVVAAAVSIQVANTRLSPCKVEQMCFIMRARCVSNSGEVRSEGRLTKSKLDGVVDEMRLAASGAYFTCWWSQTWLETFVVFTLAFIAANISW